MTRAQQGSAGKDVDVAVLLGVPAIQIASLVGLVAIFMKWGIRAAVGFWFVLMIVLIAWSLVQRRRAKQEIRSEIERLGNKVISMSYRHLRIGPFSMWDTSRSQLVYRIVVEEATGRERIAWARWGGRWYWNPDTLELKWDDQTVDH